MGPSAAAPTPKRTRTNISPLGRQFIDKFLLTYISLSGDFNARKRLYKEILQQAKTREETLDSASWSVPTIQKRLQNAHTAHNAKNKEQEAPDVN